DTDLKEYTSKICQRYREIYGGLGLMDSSDTKLSGYNAYQLYYFITVIGDIISGKWQIPENLILVYNLECCIILKHKNRINDKIYRIIYSAKGDRFVRDTANKIIQSFRIK
ncbi:hypothetical protein MUO65_02100, partial [bacterium]|nr:hypothetical protein [bacterium]